jgi:hypothetical protein
MTLQQKVLIDSINITENGIIEVRERTDIYDDVTPATILASKYHRLTLTPGQDLTGQDSKVATIATATWTPAVIAAYQELVDIPTIPATGA